MFERAMFFEAMEKLVKRAYDNAASKGYWDDPNWNFGEKVALIHSELTEMLEAHRKGNPLCPKLYPSALNGDMVTIGVIEGGGVRTISCIEEEMADVMIRLMSLAGKMNIDLGRILLAKMEYNDSKASPTKAY